MALAFYFSPQPSMSAAQYDDCIKRLNKAGAQHPKGRLYHACFGTPESVNVFDIWSSQAEFEAFGQTLMPILGALGLNPGQPMVTSMHNTIVPPAKKAAAKKPAAKKKAAPKKKTAPKKKAKARGKRR